STSCGCWSTSSAGRPPCSTFSPRTTRTSTRAGSCSPGPCAADRRHTERRQTMRHATISTGRKLALGLLLAIAALALATATPTAGAAGGRPVISVEGGPIWAVPAYGSIWIGTHHQDVYRVDPATNAILDEITLPRPACGEPAVGFGAIFIPECTDAG